MKLTQSICALQLGGEPGCRQAAMNNRAPSATTTLDFIPSLNARSHRWVTAEPRLTFGYLSPPDPRPLPPRGRRCGRSPSRRPALGEGHRTPPLPPALLLFQQGMHGRVRPRRFAGHAQGEPPPGDLDVDIGLLPARQLLQHLVPAYRLGDGEIDSVIPTRRRLGQGHRMAPLQAEEVQVAQDVLEDLVVAAEPTALEARLGPDPVQLRALQELGVLRCL